MSSETSTISGHSEIKKISVKGDSDVFGGVRQAKRAGSRKNKKDELNIAKENPVQGQTAAVAPIPASATVISKTALPIQPIQPTHPNHPSQSPHSTQSPQPVQGHSGGSHHESKRPIKVVLNKPKITHKAVKLNPKKTAQEVAANHTAAESSAHNKTKKARKITIGLPGLKRRITMAQKIRTKVSQTPIEKLREELIAKGLLKAGSKTPDEIVRQIASDAHILSKKGL